MKIYFTIPGDPVPQARSRRSANGGMYTPDKSAAYRKKCTTVFYTAYRGTPLRGPCELFVKVVKRAPKTAMSKLQRSKIENGELIQCATRPDADNYLKQISDALSGIVVVDDSRFWRVTCEKYYGICPRVEVTIWSD